MNTQNNLDTPLNNEAEISMYLRKLDKEACSLRNMGGSLEDQVKAEDDLSFIKAERRRVSGIIKLRAKNREADKKIRIDAAIVERDKKIKIINDEMKKFAASMQALKVLSQEFDNIMTISTEVEQLQAVIGSGFNLYPLSARSQLKRLKSALVSSFGAKAMGLSPGEAIQWKDFDLLTDTDKAINFVESNY